MSRRKPTLARQAFGGTHRWFLRGLRGKLVLLLGLMTLGWAIAWIQMYCVRELALVLSHGQASTRTWWLFSCFVLSSSGVVLLCWIQPRLESQVNARGLQIIERVLLDRLLRHDDAFFQKHPTGELLSRMGRDLIHAADRRLDQIRCAGALGDVLVVLAFFALNGQAGAIWVSLMIGGSALMGSIWALTTFSKAERASQRCREAQDAFQVRLHQYLEARTEIRLAAAWDQAAAGLAGPAAERGEGYVEVAKTKARLDVISNGGQLLTLVSFFALSFAGFTGLNALLPVLLREVPRVFGRSGRFIEMLARLEEGKRALRRLAVYDLDLPGNIPAAQPTPPTAEKMTVHQLTRRYQGLNGRPTGGIQDISITLIPGTLAVITGPSGCGKSTLIRVMAGLTEPGQGTFHVGEEDLIKASMEKRAAMLSFLPQFPAMIEGTIRDNLTFASLPWAGIGEEAGLIERTGVGQLAILKALNMRPSAEAWAGWSGIRQELEVQEPAAPSGENLTATTVVQAGWHGQLTEGVLWQVAEAVAASPVRSVMETMAATGKQTFQSQQNLLAMSEYEAFAALAPCPLTREHWQIKRQISLSASTNPAMDGLVWIAFALSSTLEEIALTKVESLPAVMAEIQRWARACPWENSPGQTLADDSAANWMQALLPFSPRRTGEARSGEAAVSDWVRDRPALRALLIDEGLNAAVGNCGHFLSGGQRQIIALTRVLRRKTPVVILDEPTSALDPETKSRVAACLRHCRQERILLAVTHDKELMEAADEIIALAHGRLVSQLPGNGNKAPEIRQS